LYEYATGLIRVIEKEIIDQNDLNRMIEAPDAGASFDVLNDSDLKDNTLGIKPEEFEKTIDADDLQLKNFVKKFTEENRALYHLSFLDETFFNLKLTFKEKYSGINFNDEEYSKLGAIKKTVLRKVARNRLAKTDYLNKSVANIKKAIKKNKKQQYIDTVIDKEYFKSALLLSRKIKSNILLNFFRLNIDIVNIKSILRAKKIGLPAKESQKTTISDGNVNANNLISLSNESEESFIDFLKNEMPFSKQWDEIMEDYRKNHNIIAVENKLDIFLLDFLKNEIDKISSGPEIVFYYAYLKKIMNSNIRLILTGKVNNIPIEEIKTRLKI
jgi:V/A-type H+/Na+-transporting ATPase subunit C